MQEKKKVGGKKKAEQKIQKVKSVRRKRNGPKNHELQAFCRAVNVSARPELTRGLLSERVYEQIRDTFEPDKTRNGKKVKHFRLYRATR